MRMKMKMKEGILVLSYLTGTTKGILVISRVYESISRGQIARIKEYMDQFLNDPCRE